MPAVYSCCAATPQTSRPALLPLSVMSPNCSTNLTLCSTNLGRIWFLMPSATVLGLLAASLLVHCVSAMKPKVKGSAEAAVGAGARVGAVGRGRQEKRLFMVCPGRGFSGRGGGRR